MAQQTTYTTSNSVWNIEPLLKSAPTPFSVTFSWQEQRITVQLENGEDVLKLAQIFSDFLTSNNITNKILNK